METLIYKVGSYSIVVENERIKSFELVENKGGIVPKIGQSFLIHCMKYGITPTDITPRMSDESIFTMDKMDVAGWMGLFGNPCRKQVR